MDYKAKLSNCIQHNDSHELSLLLKEIKNNNITIEVNKVDGDSDFLLCSAVDDVSKLNLLIDYCKSNKLIININDEEKNGEFLLLKAIEKKQY